MSSASPPTGSGKTVAFAIPAIEAVDPKIRAVQVLILCPTRELAVQVAEETGKIALFKKGVMGVPLADKAMSGSSRALAAGAQVVIGTPGRVMDHMERGTLKLDKLKLVILDETDRMLDMGFRDDMRHILKAVPATRQLLFFLGDHSTRHPGLDWALLEGSGLDQDRVGRAKCAAGGAGLFRGGPPLENRGTDPADRCA